MDLTQALTLLLFFCKPSALVSPRSCASSTSITHLIDVEARVLCCAATLQINQPELFSLQPLRPIEHLSLVLHYSVLPQRAWGKKQGASMGFGAWYGLQPKNSAVFRAVPRSMQTHLFVFRCRWMSLDNKHGFIFFVGCDFLRYFVLSTMPGSQYAPLRSEKHHKIVSDRK